MVNREIQGGPLARQMQTAEVPMNTKEHVAAAIEAARADLEQALQHLQQVPTLDWSAFRYGMHTLGNYLNIASAEIQLLNMALKEHPDPEVQGFLSGLDRMMDLLAYLTRHLTAASADSAVPLLREQVNLALLAERACAFYQPSAAKKRIEIIFEAPGPTVLVDADRVAVATVLDNLLSNAVKFSPPGKRIRVSVKTEPGQAVCAVQDEGPGLSVEDQARLFRKGERLGPVPTGGEPSMGYGLAISRDLVERMGGTICCESQPGQGATFSFSLPAHVEKTQ
jgi:signal transduction histidine kinase